MLGEATVLIVKTNYIETLVLFIVSISHQIVLFFVFGDHSCLIISVETSLDLIAGLGCYVTQGQGPARGERTETGSLVDLVGVHYEGMGGFEVEEDFVAVLGDHKQLELFVVEGVDAEDSVIGDFFVMIFLDLLEDLLALDDFDEVELVAAELVHFDDLVGDFDLIVGLGNGVDETINVLGD